MELTINVSDEVYRHAADLAAAKQRSVEDIFAAALEEMIQFERLREKARSGDREAFRRVMEKVPAVPPVPGDEL